MNSIIEKVFDGFKKLTPALIAVLIFTGLILFLPESFLQKMMLQSIPDFWKLLAGLLFLLCLALVVAIMLSILYKKTIGIYKRKQFIRNLTKLSRQLSSSQKSILIELLRSKDKSILLDSNSGDTLYLLNNNFIHQPEQIFVPYEVNKIVLRYVPHPWLMDLYQNNSQFRKMLENK